MSLTVRVAIFDVKENVAKRIFPLGFVPLEFGDIFLSFIMRLHNLRERRLKSKSTELVKLSQQA